MLNDVFTRWEIKAKYGIENPTEHDIATFILTGKIHAYEREVISNDAKRVKNLK